MKFNEHGHYQIESDGDILFYRVTGIWNKEASVTCIKAIEECIESRKKQGVTKPIAMIVDTQGFEGGLEEAFELWIKAAKFWYDNHVTHFIRIDDPDSARYQMFLAPIDVMVRKIAIFCFTDNFERAISHTHSLGFTGFENNTNPSKEALT